MQRTLASRAVLASSKARNSAVGRQQLRFAHKVWLASIAATFFALTSA